MPPPTHIYQPGVVDHLIPGSNPPALKSYYCGVFSLIPCLALYLGPLAIIRGKQGLAIAHQLPGETGKTHAKVGLCLGWFTTVLNVALILLSLVGTGLNISSR